MKQINQLLELRKAAGTALTQGLSDAQLSAFADDPLLALAIDEAVIAVRQIRAELPSLIDLDEAEQIALLQRDYVNFYSDDAVNPYVAVAARGPWVITLKGAVIHDNGGYGMLGAGHGPQHVIDAMSRPQVMANVMTASVSHYKLAQALRREIGQSRGGCPYSHFLCLNSGSESVTLAGRFIDMHTKTMIDPGKPHAGRSIKRLAVKGAFHGRTEFPALYSDSSRKAYDAHLASSRWHQQLITVDPYEVAQLEQVFADAETNNWHIESMLLEPVMGEGNPGRAVTPEFYAAARRLTRAHGTLLLVDSIQAGLRAHGVLSIIDYPGFEGLEEPDMETYSKALNAGQYPLSVLAVTEKVAASYQKGIYGNTMTTNPRAMDVALATLDALTPALRANIRDRGAEFVEKLKALSTRMGGAISNVQGTGLLLSCELSSDYKCYGTGSTEEYMRQHGIGVIHGGVNSLRFTPHFGISSKEVDLVVESVRLALENGPRKSMPQAA
jgi:acetylornithine/succinyldiaminopimelate/putrescine aminotransferase